MQAKPTVALLYGGKSAEYEVSIQTAFSVVNAIDKTKFNILPVHITNNGRWIEGEAVTKQLEYKEQLLLEEKSGEGQPNAWLTPAVATPVQEKPDIVFPLLHGPNGEDGTVQGLFELLGLAYVGSGVSGSAAAMDKVMMKDIFKAYGLPQAEYVAFTKYSWTVERAAILDQVETKLGFPCFVKPANNGSSIGINKSYDKEAFIKNVEEAFQFDQKVVVEESITGREIEIGVIGNDELSLSVPGEIKPDKDFYDYEAKYKDGNTTLMIPAEVDAEQLAVIHDVAKKAFKALNCLGLSRVDFFIRNSDGQVLINEVNTMPGFTPYSMFPLLWKHTGVEYPELINKLIQLGLEHHEGRQGIKYRLE